MQAACYPSKVPIERTTPFKNKLLRFLPDALGYSGRSVDAGSDETSSIIQAKLGEGARVDACFFEEALKQYDV